jgi:hypothetical protein
MPYFQMSTQNPTGQRPWNFALQGLGRLRGNRLGFYAPADYPLPQRTLGAMLPRMPMLTTSPHSGKADYGDPRAVYGALQPGFYAGLGAASDCGPHGVWDGTKCIYPAWRPLPKPLDCLHSFDPRCPGGGVGLPITVSPAGTPVSSGGGAFVCPPNAVWDGTKCIYPAIRILRQPPAGTPVSPPGSSPACPPNASCSWLTWQQQQAINAQQQAANNAAATAAAVAAAQAAKNAPAAAAVAAPSWFTDPSRELISGFPNWSLLAIAGGALFLFKKR